MKNRKNILNPRYELQQATINQICAKLKLTAFRPNYHADKNDPNTVLIYEQGETENYILALSNTDINGRFDLDYMNRGQIKTTLNFEQNLYHMIAKAYNAYLQKHQKEVI